VIEALRDETARRGQRFGVLYVPSRRQVVPGEWERTLACWPSAAPLPWDLDRPNRLLGDLMVRLQIPFLDLTGSFREAARSGSPIYFRTDWHLNRDGHRRLAGALIDWIRQEVLVAQ